MFGLICADWLPQDDVFGWRLPLLSSRAWPVAAQPPHPPGPGPWPKRPTHPKQSGSTYRSIAFNVSSPKRTTRKPTENARAPPVDDLSPTKGRLQTTQCRRAQFQHPQAMALPGHPPRQTGSHLPHSDRSHAVVIWSTLLGTRPLGVLPTAAFGKGRHQRPDAGLERV